MYSALHIITSEIRSSGQLNSTVHAAPQMYLITLGVFANNRNSHLSTSAVLFHQQIGGLPLYIYGQVQHLRTFFSAISDHFDGSIYFLIQRKQYNI